MTTRTASSLRYVALRALGALAAVGLAVSVAPGCTAGTIGDPQGDMGDDENVQSNGLTWDEFMGMVYQEPDTGMYIANGDTPFESVRELKAFYNDYVQDPNKLIVHTSGGVDAKWSATQKLNLTYCISKSSFSAAEYTATVTAMNSATAAWAAAANVKYVYSSSLDTTCTVNTTSVVFNVRRVNVNGQYLARAFFPNNARSAREVLIDGTAFGTITPWTLTGILRHELGHTLGFRHEHTRPEAATCFEDNNWRQLTTYDSASVMHYPQCNGSQTGDLVLTQKDKDGVALLYGAVGGGTCAHDKCVTGAALSASACGTAVAAVCAADPYCCSTSWGSTCVTEVATKAGSMTCNGSCAHAPCTSGTKLTAGCDSAGVVTAVCASDSYCCSTSWDSVCVSEVASIAGKNCNP